jgi:carbonic anhydrase
MYDDTIQGEMTNGNLVFVDSKQEAHYFKLDQYHLHAPSEHTIGEKYYDLELHLVHKRLDQSSA